MESNTQPLTERTYSPGGVVGLSCNDETAKVNRGKFLVLRHSAAIWCLQSLLFALSQAVHSP